jgi:NADPH-dependent 2,4-dienoyl-CoA reductase/sulfur reductase-like enzyme
MHDVVLYSAAIMSAQDVCDVLVAGGGTAGLVAAIASARAGARTVLVEGKGYVGGIAVEGGTALHSFYNLWKAFPGVPKRQVVRGLPRPVRAVSQRCRSASRARSRPSKRERRQDGASVGEGR